MSSSSSIRNLGGGPSRVTSSSDGSLGGTASVSAEASRVGRAARGFRSAQSAAAASASASSSTNNQSSSTQSFAHDVLRISTASLLHTAGFDKTHLSAANLLTEVASSYLSELARLAATVYAESQNRTEPNAVDLARSLVDLNVDLDSLREYCKICCAPVNDETNTVEYSGMLSLPKPPAFPRPKPGSLPLNLRMLKGDSQKWGDFVLRGTPSASAASNNDDDYRPRYGHELFIGDLPRFPVNGASQNQSQAKYASLRIGVSQERANQDRAMRLADSALQKEFATSYAEPLHLELENWEPPFQPSNNNAITLYGQSASSDALDVLDITQSQSGSSSQPARLPLLPSTVIIRPLKKCGRTFQIPPENTMHQVADYKMLANDYSIPYMPYLRNAVHNKPVEPFAVPESALNIPLKKPDAPKVSTVGTIPIPIPQTQSTAPSSSTQLKLEVPSQRNGTENRAPPPPIKSSISIPAKPTPAPIPTPNHAANATPPVPQTSTPIPKPIPSSQTPKTQSDSPAPSKIKLKLSLKPIKKPEPPTPTPAPAPSHSVSHHSSNGHAAASSDEIRCICAQPTVDDGKLMVACDLCGVWFHSACVRISQPPTSWVCVRCAKRKKLAE